MTDNSLLIRQNRALREEVAILREHIRQLNDALVPDVPLPSAWRMTRYQSRFIRAVRAASPGILGRERGMLAVYEQSDDFPESRALDVHIRDVRRNLSRAGVPITFETFMHIGWRMPPESCAIFDTALAADLSRWPGRAA